MQAFAQSEEAVKAAFIFNFAKFTVWPEAAFASSTAPIQVGFYGNDKLAQTFEKNIAGKNASGREFVIRRLTSAETVDECHIVYVNDIEEAAEVAKKSKGKPILTIGEKDSFLDEGGIINFMKDGSKIGFNLNLEAAKAATVTLDQRVQKLAKKVRKT
ncbi:MAG: YfiR family protein [Verrucomicrobiota bacterium]|nr:YfiR family protein [Verrucomicrobiota bacterium]